MNEEEYERLARTQAIKGQASENAARDSQMQYMLEEKEKGLAEEQLDVEVIIDNIYNLLKGKEFKEVDGVKKWVQPKDKSRTLSDWGIHRIMQTVRFHINKNNLLSNYKEEQINRLMLRFTNELNDLVLLKYEKLFQMPTFEECKEILEKKLEEKSKLRKFVLEKLGQEVDEEEIKKEFLEEIEHRIEDEIDNIKQKEMKEKLKEYGLILEELEAAVYATYNRAWKGEERGSLRRHSHFSEIFSPNAPQPKQRGGIFNWRRG